MKPNESRIDASVVATNIILAHIRAHGGFPTTYKTLRDAAERVAFGYFYVTSEVVDPDDIADRLAEMFRRSGKCRPEWVS